MNDYPSPIVPVNHVEPVPRRIRASLGGETVLDTTAALYVWEWPYYPQYFIPVADVRADLLVPEEHSQASKLGKLELHALRVREVNRPRAAKLLTESPVQGLSGTVRFDWNALDAWFEEDEQVFVHPRNPYVRVDALRSTRHVRVEMNGAVIAESGSPVMVFETGLPTRYYIERTEVNFEHLIPTDTVTACPYKGTTSGYWSINVDGALHPDLAWSYDFPTRQLLPIAGLISFYSEKVDIFLDGQQLQRPTTHFFTSASRPARPGRSSHPDNRHAPNQCSTDREDSPPVRHEVRVPQDSHPTIDQEGTMDTPYAFVVRLEARQEKAEDVAGFLAGALPLAQAEAGTVDWYAARTSPTTFWIFDTFGSEDARQAHINGEIAAALVAHADELLAAPPEILPADVLAAK